MREKSMNNSEKLKNELRMVLSEFQQFTNIFWHMFHLEEISVETLTFFGISYKTFSYFIQVLERICFYFLVVFCKSTNIKTREQYNTIIWNSHDQNISVLNCISFSIKSQKDWDPIGYYIRDGIFLRIFHHRSRLKAGLKLQLFVGKFGEDLGKCKL